MELLRDVCGRARGDEWAGPTELDKGFGTWIARTFRPSSNRAVLISLNIPNVPTGYGAGLLSSSWRIPRYKRLGTYL